ncbi:TetR/AcrR family transcriptional regulator [Temperatibacter marinus]|uniref:TetR/AcrR family transcriptional regulator n=1 Tax=Temperatibacter marinus TaxID=1456591 RepID=A0AA52HBV4_9PROT|nr:TetR/AcrR family transcriptional regulator [Temperatibacter marinus]WND04145.1 TetR/AcrR family transcriptional regulator [Temperatibacter marinus]
MKKQRLSKTGLARVLFPFFQQYGYEAASLSMLSKACGLSKASLYYHFPKGKIDMAHYVMAYAGRQMQQMILAPLNNQSLSGEDAISQSLEGVMAYYDGDTPTCLMNSLMVGKGASLFGEQVKQAIDNWTEALANALVRKGIAPEKSVTQSRQIIETIQGALIVNRLHQGRGYFDTSLKSLEKTMLK